MSDLIDRYVHQVGLYVRPKGCADIEAELRSQIQDQLEDRYGESPTQAEVATVLKQFGAPHRMAASYSGEQYLIGPWCCLMVAVYGSIGRKQKPSPHQHCWPIHTRYKRMTDRVHPINPEWQVRFCFAEFGGIPIRKSTVF